MTWRNRSNCVVTRRAGGRLAELHAPCAPTVHFLEPASLLIFCIRNGPHLIVNLLAEQSRGGCREEVGEGCDPPPPPSRRYSQATPPPGDTAPPVVTVSAPARNILHFRSRASSVGRPLLVRTRSGNIPLPQILDLSAKRKRQMCRPHCLQSCSCSARSARLCRWQVRQCGWPD